MAVELVNVGTIADDGTGDPARTAFQKINDLITEAIRIEMELIEATSSEVNLLHGIENLAYLGDFAVMIEQVDAALTDNTPTDGEITTALGRTAIVAGKNYTRFIKDTSGSGLVYLTVSDGTAWQYVKLTIAI
jgi:hypothetical protein